jgi:pimeloyl-ACP methyl ester carboxylesterase
MRTTRRLAPMIISLAAVISLGAASLSCRRPALQPNLPQIYSQPATPLREGKPPIIFIPGILGSRLVHHHTRETVWPDLRVDGDQIALPISSPVLALNTDGLVATEVVEEAKVSMLIPEISIYGPLLNALERYGGYRRASVAAPPPGGDCDSLYVFPYDWRRDIVESAQALGCMIEELKRRLGRPDLRFDIVAHSMGGLVARYYAMYGVRDVLDIGPARPDWSGARNLNRIVMIGTPNAGSMNALRVLLNGFSALSFDALPRKLRQKLPIARVGIHATFTSPSLYQLLPPQQHARFFDAGMTPLPVELYDVETWRSFEWSAAFDEAAMNRELRRLANKIGPFAARVESLRLAAERELFLRVVLRRAAAFHTALAVECPPPASLRFYFIGGDCIPTLDGAVILSASSPRTIFHPSDFRGDKWLRHKVAELIYSPGDGTVTRHSLFGRQLDAIPVVAIPTAMRSISVGTTLSCDSHNRLSRDKTLQNNLLTTLLIQ